MAQQIYLAVFGVVFVVSGVVALINPDGTARALGIAAIDITGQSEIRATYGGLILGWGLLLFAGLRSSTLAVAALACTLFCGGGLVIARFATAASFGAPGFTGSVASFILLELVMVVVAYIFFRRATRDASEPEVIR